MDDVSSQTIPCQGIALPQGSPPLATHPGIEGDPNATYKPLIAATGAVNPTQISSEERTIIRYSYRKSHI